jgi:hypothetical protein
VQGLSVYNLLSLLIQIMKGEIIADYDEFIRFYNAK